MRAAWILVAYLAISATLSGCCDNSKETGPTLASWRFSHESGQRLSTSRDLPDDVAIGVILNQLMDRVQGLITQATNAGQILEMRAASQAFLALQEAQVAYDDSLDKTLKQVNEKIAQNIKALNAMALDLEKNTAQDASNALAQAQQIVASLPFSDKTPQVRAVSPHFVSRTDLPASREPITVVKTAVSGIPDGRASSRVSQPIDSTQKVTVSGLFWYASQKNFEPWLELSDGSKLRPVENTTQSLSFLVPYRAFKAANQNSVSYAQFTLKVPYKCGFLDRCRAVMAYAFVIGTVPTTPGKVEVTTTSEVPVPEPKTVTTEQWHQTSDDGNDHPGVQYCGPSVLPTDRWVIQPDTVQFVVDDFRGGRPEKWDYSKVSDTNPAVCFSVTTVHKWGPGAVSGQVWFHFAYTLLRTNKQWVPNTPFVMPIGWGQSRIVANPGTGWKVHYTSPDGSIDRELIATDHTIPYVHVEVIGDSIEISTPTPDELDRM